MIKPGILVAMLPAVLLVAACGGSGSQQSDTSSSNSSGEEAIDFSATTLDGAEFNLSDKRGEVVALFFMAGWCGTCIPEGQAWSELYTAHKDEGLQVLMVSADPNDTPQTIDRFREAGEIKSLPWAIDKTGEVSRSLNVRALDSTVIIDRDGRIVYRDAASTSYETLENELEEVL